MFQSPISRQITASTNIHSSRTLFRTSTRLFSITTSLSSPPQLYHQLIPISTISHTAQSTFTPISTASRQISLHSQSQRCYQAPSYKQQLNTDYLKLFSQHKPTDLQGHRVWRAIHDNSPALLLGQFKRPTAFNPPKPYFLPPLLLPKDQPTWYQAHQQISQFIKCHDTSKMTTKTEMINYSRQLRSLQESAKVYISYLGQPIPSTIESSRIVWTAKQQNALQRVRTPSVLFLFEPLHYTWKAWNKLPQPRGDITQSFQTLVLNFQQGSGKWRNNTAEFPLAPVTKSFNLDSFTKRYRDRTRIELARAEEFRFNTKERDYDMKTVLFVHRRNEINTARQFRYKFHRPLAFLRLILTIHLIFGYTFLYGKDFICFEGAPFTISLGERAVEWMKSRKMSVPQDHILYQYKSASSAAELRRSEKQRQLGEKRRFLSQPTQDKLLPQNNTHNIHPEHNHDVISSTSSMSLQNTAPDIVLNLTHPQRINQHHPFSQPHTSTDETTPTTSLPLPLRMENLPNLSTDDEHSKKIRERFSNLPSKYTNV